MLILSIILVAFLLLHAILAGRFWLWNLAGVIPPMLFLVVPVILLIVAVWIRDMRSVLILLIALPIGWSFADLNLGGRQAPIVIPTTSIISWNVDYWTMEETEKISADLRARNADVILIQEYKGGEGRPLIAREHLSKEFPGYSFTQTGGLLTMSKLPLASIVGGTSDRYLRTDVMIGAARVRVYNVHLPPPFIPGLIPHPIRFLRDMHRRDAWRKEAIAAIQNDLRSETTPTIIMGDFNTTKAMRVQKIVGSQLRDAIAASALWLPRSWNTNGLRLWRIDQAFIDPQMHIASYELIDNGLSDHSLQRITIGVHYN